jgi:beta-lactam-binding protein with PASTA domain
LLRAGLQVGEVSGITMPEEPADTVVIQTPRPGAGAATPRVDVLVSEGPRESAFVMPHLVGMNEPDAQRRLDVAGLRRKVNYVSAPQWPHAAVIDQTPLAGRRITPAITIELTVAN